MTLAIYMLDAQFRYVNEFRWSIKIAGRVDDESRASVAFECAGDKSETLRPLLTTSLSLTRCAPRRYETDSLRRGQESRHRRKDFLGQGICQLASRADVLLRFDVSFRNSSYEEINAQDL